MEKLKVQDFAHYVADSIQRPKLMRWIKSQPMPMAYGGRLLAERSKRLPAKKPTLTADDVLILVESWGYVTNDNRALGPVMNDAKAKGLIKATGQFEPSINKRKHQSPTRIWQSLILPNQMELI